MQLFYYLLIKVLQRLLQFWDGNILQQWAGLCNSSLKPFVLQTEGGGEISTILCNTLQATLNANPLLTKFCFSSFFGT